MFKPAFRLTAAYLVAAMSIALPLPVMAQAPAAATPVVRPDPLPFLTIDQAIAAETHPMSKRVLHWIKLLETFVVDAKKPGFGDANVAQLTNLVDVANFRRVGNYGEVMGWDAYVGLLKPWAQHYWYTGRIRRIREVGNLVYLETEERSSNKGPFGEDGGYNKFVSNSVYEFDAKGKLTGLWVYDQMPHGNGGK